MPGDIRDNAILQSASGHLEELIAACRRGGAFHVHSPNLATDVTRKAKSLRTSLTGLIASLQSGTEPEPEQLPKRKKPLRHRLYTYPVLYETVRFVGRDGRNELEFWDFYRELAARYGQQRASDAYEELCSIDKSSLPATILLKPDVRMISEPLLGDPPSGQLR